MTQNTRRPSVPIDSDTDRVVRAARTLGTREHAALAKLAEQGLVHLPTSGDQLSEAATLAALVEMGRKELQEQVLEAEYQAIAAEQSDEDRAVRAAMRRRRRLSPRTAE
ncbi:hypothetical protein NE857_33275 [Nocardiopsis exhalans]|uniref:Molecular chaperone GrpE n=1 Tax=Nocardiopsis exhalans TaxID=163604 RepID=A0ABY5D6N7_9ACTN|nr:hypothetical protein [Nocardiopsis exhalans]USY20042.1 hypothetical protein NE857_33275 [Nocardiopsis exhalans]